MSERPLEKWVKECIGEPIDYKKYGSPFPMEDGGSAMTMQRPKGPTPYNCDGRRLDVTNIGGDWYAMPDRVMAGRAHVHHYDDEGIAHYNRCRYCGLLRLRSELPERVVDRSLQEVPERE